MESRLGTPIRDEMHAIPYDIAMNLIHINGSQLEVKQIAGSSHLAPLVFLHEGLGSVSLWTQRGLDWPQAVCKATGRAGVVYSRRGYGQSEPVPAGRNHLQPDYMHREALDALPALLEQLQIEKPVLVGHSDGATIALLHASRFAVSSCIAMAPHVLVEQVSVTAIAGAKVAFESSELPDGLRARLGKHHADVDGAFWQWNDVWLSEAFRSFDIRPECRRITAPLLLIQGLDDEYGTMLQLDEIALAVPHAVQVRLAECGHSPQRDQPQKTLEAIADFLQARD
ncbi:alpha/beta fold hydrolase [Polaromonas sp.]|uniref:alpha/beta fold hydrolase n=1 Tax=Polaromonas sp. TaxID=1869339 RepID=UPI003BAD6843